MSDLPAAGWYDDPWRRYERRYWNGDHWTEHVSNGELKGVDEQPIRVEDLPATTSAAARTATEGGWRPAAVVGVVAGAALVAAAFMPWVTMTAPFVGKITRNGVDGGGDGWLIVGAGIIAVAAAAASRTAAGRAPGLLLLVAGGIAALVGGLDFTDVSGRVASIDSEFATAEVGAGLYLVILAGIGAGVAGAMALSNRAT